MTVLRQVCPPIVTRTGARTRPKTAGTSNGSSTNVAEPSLPSTVFEPHARHPDGA